jgi:CcmD family protein
MEHIGFLFAAYAVVWIGVLLYVTALARRSRNLERDIEELRGEVAKRGR